jgi:hypothetical protein
VLARNYGENLECLRYINNRSLSQDGANFQIPPAGYRRFNMVEKKLFESPCVNYTSILVLLSAMALSRFGLWLTDLVIHQLIQENVDENKRGIIGGVQSSLNRLFDLIKYGAVILLSDVHKYGFLVIMSISAVFSAYLLYIAYTAIYSWQEKSRKFSSPKEEQPMIDRSMIRVVVPNHQADDEKRYVNEEQHLYVNDDAFPPNQK